MVIPVHHFVGFFLLFYSLVTISDENPVYEKACVIRINYGIFLYKVYSNEYIITNIINRAPYVDIAKGIAILSVVLLHVDFVYPKLSFINISGMLG